jgi:hypothetical protein
LSFGWLVVSQLWYVGSGWYEVVSSLSGYQLVNGGQLFGNQLTDSGQLVVIGWFGGWRSVGLVVVI